MHDPCRRLPFLANTFRRCHSLHCSCSILSKDIKADGNSKLSVLSFAQRFCACYHDSCYARCQALQSRLKSISAALNRLQRSYTFKLSCCLLQRFNTAFYEFKAIFLTSADIGAIVQNVFSCGCIALRFQHHGKERVIWEMMANTEPRGQCLLRRTDGPPIL